MRTNWGKIPRVFWLQSLSSRVWTLDQRCVLLTCLPCWVSGKRPRNCGNGCSHWSLRSLTTWRNWRDRSMRWVRPLLDDDWTSKMILSDCTSDQIMILLHIFRNHSFFPMLLSNTVCHYWCSWHLHLGKINFLKTEDTDLEFPPPNEWTCSKSAWPEWWVLR